MIADSGCGIAWDQVAEATADLPREVAAKETAKEDVRMTSEQVTELGHALEILSAKSSVMKERSELRRLMEDQKLAEVEVRFLDPLPPHWRRAHSVFFNRERSRTRWRSD